MNFADVQVSLIPQRYPNDLVSLARKSRESDLLREVKSNPDCTEQMLWHFFSYIARYISWPHISQFPLIIWPI